MRVINNIQYINKSELLARENWNIFLYAYLGIDSDTQNIDTISGNTELLFMVNRINQIEQNEAFQKYVNASMEEKRKLYNEARQDILKTFEIASMYSIGVVYSPVIQALTVQYQIRNNPDFTFSIQEVEWPKYIVNHIRHTLTNYEIILGMIKGHRGAKKCINILKCRTLSRIASVYKEYESECFKQAKQSINWCSSKKINFDWISGNIIRNTEFDPYKIIIEDVNCEKDDIEEIDV